MKAFTKEVSSLSEARLLLDTLAEYDLFQLNHNVKGDYANAGGLSVWDGDWVDWYDEDGNDIDEFTVSQLKDLERV